jgi:hypothetical protein
MAEPDGARPCREVLLRRYDHRSLLPAELCEQETFKDECAILRNGSGGTIGGIPSVQAMQAYDFAGKSFG